MDEDWIECVTFQFHTKFLVITKVHLIQMMWYSAQFMAPIYPVYIKGEDGKDVLDADGNRQLDYGDGSVQRPQYSDFNPVGGLVDDKADIKNRCSWFAHIFGIWLRFGRCRMG